MRGNRMSLVSWIKLGLTGMGILCIVAGGRRVIPALWQAGMGSLGLGLMVIGGEAMVTRRFEQRHRGFAEPRYRRLGAVLYGIVFAWLGMALIAGALMLFLGAEQGVLHATLRRPGFALLNLSFLALAASGIALTGFFDARPGAEAGSFLKALSVLRSIPGLVLLLLALALLALGLLEIVSPATFDGLGGGFLEVLFVEGAS